jgi:hypothetical protein
MILTGTRLNVPRNPQNWEQGKDSYSHHFYSQDTGGLGSQGERGGQEGGRRNADWKTEVNLYSQDNFLMNYIKYIIKQPKIIS